MGRSGSMLSPILVGRDGHLEVAVARLADARAGRGRTLLIAGEAGIGKTRFLHAVIRQGKSMGFAYAKGDIAPQDHDVPGGLLMDLARTMLDAPSLAPAGDAILDRWRAATAVRGAHRRRLVLDTVEALRAAATGPTIYAFEDLQWADDLSLEAIAELARTIEGRSVAVLAAYRRDETGIDAPLRAWRSRLVTQRLADEIRLDRLTRAQTATVVTLLLDTGLPAPREVVDAVHDRSDGVPLHVEEIIAAVRAGGPVDEAAVRDAGVPDTIEDAVLTRIARLTPEAQAVARAGAVLGRCFVPDVLAGVLDVPVGELEDPLEELVDHAILFPFGSVDIGYHDFRHQLLRDALYAHTPARERRRYHARAAEFGAQLVGATEVHRSLHYAEAGLRDEAYRAAMAGAQAAAGVAAHREAFELYRRAVDNQPAGLPAIERAELFEALASEALALEDMDVAGAMAAAAAEAYRRAGATIRAVGAAALEAVVSRRDGWPASTRIELLDTLIAEAESAPAHPDAASVIGDLHYYLAMCLADRYDFAAARSALATARRVVAGSPSDALLFDVLEGWIDFTEIGPEVGLERVAVAATTALEQRVEVAGLGGSREASILATRAMDYGAARRWIETGVRFGAETEQAHCAHVMTGMLAIVQWATGEWDAAADTARHVLADRGCQRGATAGRWALGYLALGQGDRETSERELRDALAWAERSEALDLMLPAQWGLAEAALLADDPTAAAERCEHALGQATAAGERALVVPFVVTGVRAFLATGRMADAERWLGACADHLATTPTLAHPAIDHGSGLIALTAGSTVVARRSLETAVAGWDDKGRVWEASWARLDLAAALARSNKFATAVALASQVRETADRLGSPVLRERADAVARHGRGRIVEVEPWHPLTAREFEVARLIGEGCTNGEIADALGIAPKTASAHVEHILAKLGASRRAEIARWASGVAPSSVA